MSTTANMSTENVVIVGAGISGILCAKELIRNGFRNVKIVEASDRVGGRIHSVELNRNDGSDELRRIENGATWIHGIDGNPIYDIATAENLLQDQDDITLQTRNGVTVLNLLENGTRVPLNIVADVGDKIKEGFAKAASIITQISTAQNQSPDVGVQSFVKDNMADYFEQFTGEDLVLRKAIFNQKMSQTTVCGVHSMEELAANQFGNFMPLPGDDITIPVGFSKVVDFLIKDFPSNVIMLNHQVNKIIWCDQSLQHSVIQDEASCKVICSNGVILPADIVVITASLAYLKENHYDIFSPKLPQEKIQAIAKLKMGTVNKIFLEFEHLDFLPNDVFYLKFHWKGGERTGKELQELWYKKISSAFVYGDPGDKDRFLMFWITGHEAEHMETLPEKEVGRTCVDVLKQFLNNHDIPLPKSVHRTKWRSNPFIRGSYSVIPIGATVEDIHELARPVYNHNGEPVLLFAGEAVHPKFYSTSHGALLSGQRAAEKIIQSNLKENILKKNPLNCSL